MSIQTKPLGEFVKIRTGKKDANVSSPGGKYPFFSCSREILAVDEFSYDTECVLVAGNGDLNVKYYNGKFDAYQRTYIIESVNPDKLDARFLYYFMDKYVEKLRKLSIGGVIKYIKLNNLTDAPLPQISLEKQKEIVRILDQANNVVQKRRQAIEKINSVSQAIFLEMFGDPVINSKKWELKKFGDIGTLDRGVSKHRPRNAPELLGGKYPLIQTGDVGNSGGYITNYTSTYSEIGLKQSKMWPTGTLCITIAANIAKTGILQFDACFPDSVVAFRSENNALIEYVRIWLSFLQKKLEAEAPESAQKNINLGILRNLNIPLPPSELLLKFHETLICINKLSVNQVTSLNTLSKLTESLQSKYFVDSSYGSH